MDIRRTAMEIGLFETGVNLTRVLDSQAVREKAGAVMPLPLPGLEEQLEAAGRWLSGFGKDRYLFLTPELALLEGLDRAGDGGEAILVLPCDMEEQAGERLRGNLPQGRRSSLLKEPYFPSDFCPGNGLMVVCGYLAGGRAMVPEQTYRLLAHYGGFWGRKVFLPYVRLEEALRYEGWMEVNTEQFNGIWEGL